MLKLQTVFSDLNILNRDSNSVINFFEFASLIGLLLYSIWSRLWISLKALVV
jgi:hypothetical protein